MRQTQSSQLDPLPTDLPFTIISKTIGRGAYASIKKACPKNEAKPIFAVKLIHKAYATKNGRISPRQIAMEVSLHSHIGEHINVIEWFATGEDAVWRWIAMEYAAGGDLFDKIEADVGVQEDIAHLYFQQLVSGVSFIHSKGVAHRDLKPENILLSEQGDLKIADFGLATMFEYRGERKKSSTTCGSPPYIAPEVLATARPDRKPVKYSSDLADIWSCGVILFVLLVGNTPWDEPNSQSWEYQEYLRTEGRSTDTLWERIPEMSLSLLRGMMSVDTKKRFSFEMIRLHPWYTRRNALLNSKGKVTDPVQLATQMLGNLHIDLKQEPTPSQRSADAMDVDMDNDLNFASTQPEVPIADPMFDWERPMGRTRDTMAFSSTQPVSRRDADAAAVSLNIDNFELPSMSQFSSTPGQIPLTLTQQAKKFRDIVPNKPLTRFFSHRPPKLLDEMLRAAMHTLNVPLGPPGAVPDGMVLPLIRVRTVDGRKQSMHGEIVVSMYYLPDNEGELLQVEFLKIKGDPLEWRRFFKKVALLCKDAIYNSEA